MPLVYFFADGIEGKLEPRPRWICLKLLLWWAELVILMRAPVEVEYVDHGKSITVLISIEDNADLVEDDLGVDLGRFGRHGLVDDNAGLARDGFEDVLVGRRADKH